jgi:hypothetical protein
LNIRDIAVHFLIISPLSFRVENNPDHFPSPLGTQRNGEWLLKEGGLIQVDIGGHPPSPTAPKHVFSNFGNLLYLAVFNFRGHFEALNDVF